MTSVHMYLRYLSPGVLPVLGVISGHGADEPERHLDLGTLLIMFLNVFLSASGFLLGHLLARSECFFHRVWWQDAGL